MTDQNDRPEHLLDLSPMDEVEMVTILELIARNGSDNARIAAIKQLRQIRAANGEEKGEFDDLYEE